MGKEAGPAAVGRVAGPAAVLHMAAAVHTAVVEERHTVPAVVHKAAVPVEHQTVVRKVAVDHNPAAVAVRTVLAELRSLAVRPAGEIPSHPWYHKTSR